VRRTLDAQELGVVARQDLLGVQVLYKPSHNVDNVEMVVRLKVD
jgi:hypothetical protein